MNERRFRKDLEKAGLWNGFNSYRLRYLNLMERGINDKRI